MPDMQLQAEQGSVIEKRMLTLAFTRMPTLSPFALSCVAFRLTSSRTDA